MNLFRRPSSPARTLAILSLVAIPGALQAAPSPSEELNGILERFDRVQLSIRTLSAEFVETTRSPLLKEPIEARGRFYLTKPDSVAWEYTTPESMRFVLANTEYVGVFPERKKAERRDLHRWSERIFRFFGVGQGSEELRKFYEISLGDPGPEMVGHHLLLLEPKKRRVRKNVEEVRLWVDATSLLPTRIDYSGADGNLRSIRFRDLRKNPDLSASLYRVKIPEGYAVSEGFTAFSAASRAR